jgi:hypothetical protein
MKPLVLSFLALLLLYNPLVLADSIEPGIIYNDMRIPDDRPEGYGASGYYAASPTDPLTTSEYMYGDISVAIILPESNGAIDPNTEDWTQEEIDNVYAEVQDGLQWWITNKHPLAEVSFIVHDPLVIETSYEPITRSSSPSDPEGEKIWINEIMEGLGYTDASQFDNVRSFDHDLRTQDNTDWAFTIFVVDSSEDGNGMFADYFFAYAYTPGPFMVMTYDNNGWGIENMDIVTAHEAGHIFGTDDEYSPCSCTKTGGFLNVENQNCVNSCDSDVDCIMRQTITSFPNNEICPYTEGQIGWRDLNANEIIDCIDSEYNPDTDTDGDGIVDYWDDCTDTDGDGYGDPGFPSNICEVDNCTDTDGDGYGDPGFPSNICELDNCPNTPNQDQADTYPPPPGNGIGDACDCEANFDCDLDVDGSEVTAFLAYFGRGKYTTPCTNSNPCDGDFLCDGDVDGSDVTKFLEDFGRGQYDRPCPQCTGEAWCNYQ